MAGTNIPVTNATIRGGSKCAVLWSGGVAPNLSCAPGAITSGGHTLLQAGAGRLYNVAPHTQMASGLPIFFYDAGTIAPSGISVSGQWILGAIAGTFTGGSLGSGSPNPFTGSPINYDMPYNSGLCVAAPSGTPGFTVSFSPGGI